MTLSVTTYIGSAITVVGPLTPPTVTVTQVGSLTPSIITIQGPVGLTGPTGPAGTANLANLPTTLPATSGVTWLNGGVVCIS